MNVPTLSPDADKVLRHAERHFLVHAKALRHIDINNHLGRNSSAAIRELAVQGLLRSPRSSGDVVPTLSALRRWDPSCENLANEILGELFVMYRAGNSLPGVHEVAEALAEKRFLLPDGGDRFRFLVACVIPDLAPVVTPSGKDSNGLPTMAETSPDIYEAHTLADVEALRLRTPSPMSDKGGGEDVFPVESHMALPSAAAPLGALVERLRVAGALSPAFAILLGRDAGEVGICERGGATKAALILCGGILEGVLVSVLNQNAAIAQREFEQLSKGKAHKTFPDEASLPDLVALARRELQQGLRPLLRKPHQDLAAFVNGHRDLVHPHAEVRAEQLPVSVHTLAAVLGGLQAVLDGVATEVEAGWLSTYLAVR